MNLTKKKIDVTKKQIGIVIIGLACFFIIFSNKYNESVYPHGRIYDLIRYQSNNY